MNGNGDLSTKYFGDGSSSTPSQAFFYEPSTGIYNDTSAYPNTAWELTKKGRKRIRVDDNQTYLYGTVSIDNLVPGTGGDTVTLSAGTHNAPSLNFTGDSNTGIYSPATDNVGIATGGVIGAYFNATNSFLKNVVCDSVNSSGTMSCGTNALTCGSISSGSVTVPVGSSSTPSLTFSGHTTSGLYYDQTLNPGVTMTAGGTPTMNWTNTGILSFEPLTVLSSGSSTTIAADHISTIEVDIANGGLTTTLIPGQILTNTVNVDHLRPNTNSSISLDVVTSFAPGNVTTPGLFLSTSTNSGLYSSTPGELDFAISGSKLASITSSGLQSFGALNAGTNALTIGPITSTGTFSNGTNSVSCGPITSTGNVTYPRYWIRLYRAAVQSVGASTATAASWDTLETTGGGSSNWGTITLPLTQIIIPLGGMYIVNYLAIWSQNTVGVRNQYLEVNNGGSTGTTRRYAETNINAATLGNTSISAPFLYRFTAGDTISLTLYQSSLGSLNFSNQDSGNSLSAITINRLSE